LPKTPFTWLTTYPCDLQQPGPLAMSKNPPALQLPGEVQDTDATPACSPVSSAAMPGTSRAVPQAPCTSLTTNAEVFGT